MTLLQATAISVRFGGVLAVDGVDLAIEAGRLVGLIGPNGAGKTSVLDALTGFVPATGSVRLAGRELRGLGPHHRARSGLARTWQSLELFDDLSVTDNLRVAAERLTFASFVSGLAGRRHRAVPIAVASALAAMRIERLADARPSELSHGERTLVGVARALVSQAPLVCLDEPAAGLDASESTALGATLRRIVDDGRSILLVDHDMGLVLGCSDEVHVMAAGRVIARGAPDEVRTDPAVIATYLGTARSRSGTGVGP